MPFDQTTRNTTLLLTKYCFKTILFFTRKAVTFKYVLMVAFKFEGTLYFKSPVKISYIAVACIYNEIEKFNHPNQKLNW